MSVQTKDRLASVRDGLTLIELMVVLAILALAAGLAVPRLSGLAERATLDAAQARVADAVRLARGLAIRRGTAVIVTYAPKTIRLLPQEEDAPEPPYVLGLPAGTHLVSVQLDRQPVPLSHRQVRVRLSASGFGPDHTLLLAEDAGPGRRWVHVAGLGGAILSKEERRRGG